MVGPRGPESVEGILSLTGEALSFSPLDGEGLRLPAGAILRSRRLRASPALKVTHVGEAGPQEVFFFFSKPPPLPQPARLPGLATKSAERTAGAMTLRAQSKRLKKEIEAWVEAIRELERAGPG